MIRTVTRAALLVALTLPTVLCGCDTKAGNGATVPKSPSAPPTADPVTESSDAPPPPTSK